VKIEIPPLTGEQWERAIDGMAQQAIFGAKLLAGEIPQNIEEAFLAAGMSLLPQRAQEITTQCSCPDYANPCKHIAAVYYLLGERFDEDPFLIFHLRGRTREQIVDALRARRAAATGDGPEREALPVEPVPQLADLLSTFYQAGAEMQNIAIHIAAPEIEAAILRRLGDPPAGTYPDLRATYQAMSAHVLDKVLGER
jgi:uncharacterized Zn finger protein